MKIKSIDRRIYKAGLFYIGLVFKYFSYEDSVFYDETKPVSLYYSHAPTLYFTIGLSKDRVINRVNKWLRNHTKRYKKG